MSSGIRTLLVCALGPLLAASPAAPVQEPPPDVRAQAEKALESLRSALEAAHAGEVTPAQLAAHLDALARRDLDGVMDLFAEDTVLDLPRVGEPSGQRVAGEAAIRKAMSAWFASLPDARYGEARHLVIGDRGLSEWTLTATRPDGGKIVARGCDLFEFRDGRIVRKDTYLKLVEP